MIISPYHLEPAGRVAIAKAAARMRHELAARRTLRMLEQIKRRISEAPTTPLLPLPEVVEIDVEERVL